MRVVQQVSGQGAGDAHSPRSTWRRPPPELSPAASAPPGPHHSPGMDTPFYYPNKGTLRMKGDAVNSHQGTVGIKRLSQANHDVSLQHVNQPLRPGKVESELFPGTPTAQLRKRCLLNHPASPPTRRQKQSRQRPPGAPGPPEALLASVWSMRTVLATRPPGRPTLRFPRRSPQLSPPVRSLPGQPTSLGILCITVPAPQARGHLPHLLKRSEGRRHHVSFISGPAHPDSPPDPTPVPCLQEVSDLKVFEGTESNGTTTFP